MELFQAVILGLIQGLTEFLPVSSSGHLVLGQHLFGITEPALFFDISVHLGTLCAVLIVFRNDIGMMFVSGWKAARSFFRSAENRADSHDEGLRMMMLIILGSFPTALIGLALKRAEHLFASLPLVGAMLLITAALLWATRNRDAGGGGISNFSWPRALVVGIAQGLAVLPGISRSGATISVGLFLGLDRRTSARFSFLLSIPAIIGAELLSVGDVLSGQAALNSSVVLGALTAFVVGYAALKILLKIVGQGRFYLFAPYCLVLGLVTLGIAVM